MTGDDLTAIRQQLGLTRLQFARLLGYTGTDRNDIMRLRKYEKDKKQIPLYIARLAYMLRRWHDATGHPPLFPNWPGYDYDHTPDHDIPVEPGDGVLESFNG